MMSMQELFYGDRELTWIIPSYPQYYDQEYDQADFPRSAYQHHQQQQQQHQKLVPHRVYYQDDEADEAASRYRTQYNQRSQAAFRLQSPTRHNYQQADDVLPYAPPETRYKGPIAETRYNTRPMQSLQVVELMVPLCCTKCEEKVKKALLEMEGVERVKTDQENQMVTVTGMFVNPTRVLRRVKKIKKRSELIMPNWIPTEKHSTSNYAAESAKSYSRYPQSSSQVHTQQLYDSPGEDFRGQEFNYPHNFYARPSYQHH